MNLLVTGSGNSGSWQIRGLQLGAAIGATVVPKALDVAAFDAVVLVKRPLRDVVARAHAAGVPIIYDVVDAWPQPEGNDWVRHECMAWLQGTVKWMRPRAIVAATRWMAEDCAELGVPVLALPHHGRPGLKRTEIRPLQVVGYEGGEQHLGAWRFVLEAECARRGWRFVINPASINDLDVVVALRERTGYAATSWKSNVKLANAQASGTPIICAVERGYYETMTGAELFVKSADDVAKALDALEPIETRRHRADMLFAGRQELGAIARTYRHWLEEMACAPALSS